MKIAIVLVFILLINIPFGYWRTNTRKFSLQWILAIHLPVPIDIGIKRLLLDPTWYWYLLLLSSVITYAAGQYVGGKIRHYFVNRGYKSLSSCLVSDVARVIKNHGHNSDSKPG